MIYPTRRAVFLAALGIPAALLVALMLPRLWLAGATWVIFVSGVMLLDAVAAGAPAFLRVDPDLPNANRPAPDTTPRGRFVDARHAQSEVAVRGYLHAGRHRGEE